MKRIFKCLIPFSTVSVLIASASCACAKKEEEKKEIETIEIVTELDDVTIKQDEGHTSQTIEARCYDKNYQEIETPVKFHLTLNGNQDVPSWVTLNDKNQIHIDSVSKEVGTYMITVSASDQDENIHSMSKSFNLNVISDKPEPEPEPEKPEVPDKISLSIENNVWCMVGEETIIPTVVTPSKEGVEPSKLLKECSFDISVEGKSTDLQGQPLFRFSGETINPNLIVSHDTDASYYGSYKLTITASLLAKPEIKDTKELTFNIDNIKVQKDEYGNTYTRNSRNEDWTISLLNKQRTFFYDMKNFIQNKPVTSTADYLCKNSEITQMVELILPKSVTKIGNYSFYNQQKLCSVRMEGVKTVGEWAFYNNVILTFQDDWPQPNFQEVGEWAFYNCQKLSFGGAHDFTKIGEYAFYNASISKLEIGENCTEIGPSAFTNNALLDTVIIHTKKPPILQGNIFGKNYKLKSIKVPNESVSDYNADEQWKSMGISIEGI